MRDINHFNILMLLWNKLHVRVKQFTDVSRTPMLHTQGVITKCVRTPAAIMME